MVCLQVATTMEHYRISMQEAEFRKGPWLEEEDERLIAVVSILGERRWDALAKASGKLICIHYTFTLKLAHVW